ncbi:MATE family efflux transporter [Salana multivorans]
MPEPALGTTSSSTLTSAARSMLRISGPLIANGLVTVAVTMNDSVLLGRSGAEVLASAAASSAIVLVGVGMLIGLVGTPTQILVARATGAGDAAGAARAAERTVPLAVAVSLVFGVGIIVWARPLVAWTGGSAIDTDLAAAMARVLASGVLIASVSTVGRGYATGLGATRIVVVASLVAAVLDIAVSLLLLQLIGPIGVTIGTLFSYLGGLATYLIWLNRRRRASQEAPRLLRSMLAPPGKDQREPLSLGWPEALLGATSWGAGVVVVVLLSTSPPAVLAATRALESMTTLLWVVLMSFSSAGLTLLGHARGANDQAAYRNAVKASLAVSGTAGVTLALAMPFVTVPLLSLAIGEQIAQEAAAVTWLAWTVAPWITISTMALSVCRSFRDTRTPMWASVASEYAVFLPAGWLLCRVLDGGIVGLFVAHHIYYVAFIAIAVTMAIVHLRRPWENLSRFE